MHDADVPRIAIYSSWSGTQEIGWVPLHVRQVRHSVRPDLQGARQEGQPARRLRRDPHADADRERARRSSQPPAARPVPYMKTRQVQVPRDVRRVARHHRRHGRRRRRRVREVPRRRRHADRDGRRGAVPDRLRLRAHRSTRRRRRQRLLRAASARQRRDRCSRDHPVFYGYTEQDHADQVPRRPADVASASPIRAACWRATSAATPRC